MLQRILIVGGVIAVLGTASVMLLMRDRGPAVVENDQAGGKSSASDEGARRPSVTPDGNVEPAPQEDTEIVASAPNLAPQLAGTSKAAPAGEESPKKEGQNAEGTKKEGEKKKFDRHAGEPYVYEPAFKNWGKPAATFVLSGEMHGYVEPCGCSANQLGGLSRRADLFRQMRDKGWPVTGLDVGGLVSNATRRQAEIKLRMALGALKELDYAGIALGVEELQMGVGLLQFHEDERPPFLSCNLELFGAPDIGSHVTKRVAQVGGMKVGLTGVFGESYKPKVLVGGNEASGDIKVLDPIESLTKTVAELEAEKPDLLILLAHTRVDEARSLAEKFPQFNLIVTAGGPEDPDPRPKFVDKTLLVMPGKKGKHVVVVGWYPDDPEQKLKYEVVALDGGRFQETPSMRDRMQEYQEALAVQNLVAGEPAIEDPRNTQIDGENPYVGAKVCSECHKKSYDKWLTTGHARATETLKVGRKDQKGPWVKRMDDPECIACHTTGWDTGRGDPKDYFRFKTGFESEAVTPHLTGNQCENCHGPGGRHVDLERQYQRDEKMNDELVRFREFVQLFIDEAGAKVCVKCHDGDNDPHFKPDGDVFESYWDEIKHPWRD